MIILVRPFLIAVFLLTCWSSAFATLGPENVAVVVNGDSWASLTVASEYRRLRHIPDRNFIVLKGLSSVEIMDVEHFRQEILEPVFATIDRRKLVNQIDCLAYSVDLPYAIDVSGDMAGKKFPLVITPMASTNGLTYLHEWVTKRDTDYLRLDINRYNRRTLPLPGGSSLSVSETAEYARGLDLYEQKQYVKAAETLSALLAKQRSDPNICYDLACCWSLAGRPADAIDALKKAVAAGWRNAIQTTADPDLKSLAGQDEFKRLVERMKSMPVRIQPPLAFRASYAWNERGEPAPNGPHYMLSTMLGVTCGRGNSVNQVLESLRRSAKADGAMPKGTIYFPENGDVRSTTRAWAFNEAAAELKSLGVNAIVENGILPMNRPDVAGAMIGISDFDWGASKSKILPGAIVEHFTSFGGIISERGGQTPCTEFIANGASGTSGTVTEPYALQQKFPTAFMQVQYCRGWSLAESYYQSLSGPYQLLIIGDPLCRPWAKRVNPAPQVAAARGSRSVKTAVPPASPSPNSDSQLAVQMRNPINIALMEVTPSLPQPAGEALSAGLSLSVEGETPVVVKDTFDGAWLANLIKEPGKRFTLTGYFDVTKQDLYQVQLKTNTGAVVKISGAQVLNAHDDKQLFAPVLLAPGRHRLEILGRSSVNSVLDIRLGAAGVQHLSAATFKHPSP